MGNIYYKKKLLGGPVQRKGPKIFHALSEIDVAYGSVLLQTKKIN